MTGERPAEDEERDTGQAGWTVRRILVALDASPHSLAALRAAIDLAARAGAELLAVFVEDENLLRLANLPFARELGSYSGTLRVVDQGEIERQLRARARQAEAALAAAAGRAQVRYTFRVVRGAIGAQLLAASAEADLITLGKVGWSPVGRRRVGSTARSIVAEATGTALIVQPARRPGRSIVVVYNGSTLAQRALATAVGLARGGDEPVIVVVAAGEAADAALLEADVAGRLAARGVAARFRWLTPSAGPRLAEAVRAEDGGLLVLPADPGLLQAEALLALVEEVELPVLVIR